MDNWHGTINFLQETLFEIQTLNMLTQRANIHRHKIPALGAVGYLIIGMNRWEEPRYFQGSKRKYQVIGFPLCDNDWPYSIGIHTFYARNLQNGKIVQVSGFYFSEQ
jgi:hypothetical protein